MAPGPDKLRRLLLALVVTVVVARPLVGGEQPGYISDLSDPGSMALTFLTLVGVVAWAGWRMAMRQPALYLGWADLAVFAVGLFAFLGAAHGVYRRAAWLSGWDWLGMALLYLLVRQLAVRPEERHGWVAVLLAGAVAVSAEGVYQAAYLLPAQARAELKYRDDNLTEDKTAFLRSEYFLRGVAVTPLELHQMLDKQENRRASGPYFHPASLALVLALALPLAFGALLASVRGKSPAWQTGLASVCLLLLSAALVLTWERGVLLLAVTAVAALVCGIFLKAPSGRIIAALLLGLGFAGSLTLWPDVAEVWPNAWRLLQDHCWLGVGPAQFALFYPRYMSETAGGNAITPGGAVLDVWADAGVFGVAALALAVILIGRAAWRWSSSLAAPAPRGAKPPADESSAPDDSVNWEFYLGGMFGLVLAFILRAATVPPEDVVAEAIVAGLRAVAWFAAFALYEGIGWTVEEHLAALLTGTAAMFLCLLVLPGIGFPSVAVSLWVAVALILATVSPRPAEWLSRQVAVGLVTAPAFVALAFGYFAFFFYPAAASAAALRRAEYAGLVLATELRKPATDRAFPDPIDYIRRRMIQPVERVWKEDPENSRLLTYLASTYGQVWELSPGAEAISKRAVELAGAARVVDPEGFEGYQVEDDLRRRFAAMLLRRAELLEKEKPDPKQPAMSEAERKKRAAADRQAARQQYDFAASLLRSYIPRDPTDPRLRFALASALYGAGKDKEAREAAELAGTLDGSVKPPRKLPDQQREQIEKWLKGETKR